MPSGRSFITFLAHPLQVLPPEDHFPAKEIENGAEDDCLHEVVGVPLGVLDELAFVKFFL